MEIIWNAVNDYNPYVPYQPVLVPNLNTIRTDMAYEEILGEPDFTIQLVDERPRWKTFFCKVNGQVYEIITDEDLTIIHRVRIVTHTSQL
jgi:hypothetical protein